MVLSCNELSKLTIEGNKAWLSTLNERQFVDHVGEPLTLFLPAYMQSPKCVLQRLVAHAYLCCEWLFTKVHQGTTHSEVLVDGIVHVQAEHRLSLHAISVVALYGSADIGACIDETLVDDGYAAHIVIDRIVSILC